MFTRPATEFCPEPADSFTFLFLQDSLQRYHSLLLGYLKMCFLFSWSDPSFYAFPIHATCTSYPIHVDLVIVDFIIK
jgi:hypothetical protein